MNAPFCTAARLIVRFLPTLLTLLSLACPAFCDTGVCTGGGLEIVEEFAPCGCFGPEGPAPSEPCSGECDGCFCDGALLLGDAPAVVGGGDFLSAFAAAGWSVQADRRVRVAELLPDPPRPFGRTPLSAHAGLLL